jgi:hypothetical protein
MIANYSQESSLRVAIQETFSGERPCGMCKVIQATEGTDSSSHNKARATADELRLFLLLVSPLTLAPDENTLGRTQLQRQFINSCFTTVPTPPPKQQA